MIVSASFLRQATGGRWWNLSEAEETTKSFLSIGSDSRTVENNSIFLALVGETFDGHNFLAAAAQAGAGAVIAATGRWRASNITIPVLEVEDTLQAYWQIAEAWRKQFSSLSCVAVTGSVGKTSTKELIRAILLEAAGGDPEAVLATEGNTNNHIGVPRNLLKLTSRHRYAVLELGTSSPGEIAPLAKMVQMQVALVNSIAPCHLEKLIDLPGVAREKGSIYGGLPENGGVSVLPVTSEANDILRQATRGEVMTFGVYGSGATVEAKYLHGTLSGSKFYLKFPDGKQFQVSSPLSGAHQALNSAAAATVAYAMKIAPETIVHGLEKVSLPGMRMEITAQETVTFVNDAYNANPGSMKAVLQHLAEFIHPEEWILVLGDMLELGEFEVQGHREVLNCARQLFPDIRILTVGPRFAAIGGGDFSCNSVAEAGPLLSRMQQSGDYIFLKGSHGMHLEKLIGK